MDPGASDVVSNDNGWNWCLGQTDYGTGDLGSPGEANPPCPVVEPTVALNEIHVAGDWVELVNLNWHQMFPNWYLKLSLEEQVFEVFLAVEVGLVYLLRVVEV